MAIPRAVRRLGELLSDYTFLALVPPVALTFDYSMTFSLAGGHGAVMLFEASPVIRWMVAHHLMRLYYLGLFLLYYLCTYAVLRFLHRTEYYPFGAAVILTVSLCHLLGGLSWVIRSDLYSRLTQLAALLAIAGTCAWFARVLYRKVRGGAVRPVSG